MPRVSTAIVGCRLLPAEIELLDRIADEQQRTRANLLTMWLRERLKAERAARAEPVAAK